MMHLTDTQTQMLAAAATQQNRLVKPPAIPPAPRSAIEAKLRSASLIEQVTLDSSEHAALAWRQADGAAIGYRITAAGLAAIGAAQDTAQASADMTEPQEVPKGPSDAVPPQEAAQEALDGTNVRRAPNTLQRAATALLAAWDATQDRAGLEEGIAELRTALAGKPGRRQRDPGAARQPREGTKQQQVLELLRRPEGATVAQIAEATGWQPHTVRGFFAGLKARQGIAVEVLERVRQVGPDRQGAKGSYSIYRIADAG